VVYIDRFHLVAITDDFVDDAINLKPTIGAADAIHVVTALFLMKSLPLTIATHDAQMARALSAPNISMVIDPVTDDPNRPPVA